MECVNERHTHSNKEPSAKRHARVSFQCTTGVLRGTGEFGAGTGNVSVKEINNLCRGLSWLANPLHEILIIPKCPIM